MITVLSTIAANIFNSQFCDNSCTTVSVCRPVKIQSNCGSKYACIPRDNHLLQLENPRFVRLENGTEIQTIPSWLGHDAFLAIDTHFKNARAAHASLNSTGPNFGFYVDLVNVETISEVEIYARWYYTSTSVTSSANFNQYIQVAIWYEDMKTPCIPLALYDMKWYWDLRNNGHEVKMTFQCPRKRASKISVFNPKHWITLREIFVFS